ncbi:phosphotransferase family protein [Cellulosimicrobium marinum]|uniref:phosphotransferase family protein n=1 Tax=Cellulosimicrobium marinum TaxID=1638992 RepID=UPI001E2A6C93|nr:aminoglycoside phosphotransferase family protein [Cellulosimicrobium marinum]MCB7135013.1 aminoglycoside phosphotransferase family protein [Cellulosimicrobium marinum]
MLTRTPVTPAQAAAIVAPLGEAVGVEPLTGGMFASVLAVDLAPHEGAPAGPRVVVKVTAADTSRLLRYEHGIHGTEAAAYRAAHAAGLPVPRVLHVDTSREHVDGDALVVTFLDGTLWSTLELDPPATAAVRRELGTFMARLHRVGRGRADAPFGYPAPASGLAAATWPEAVSLMVEAALDDAARWGVDLPAERVRSAVERQHDALSRVTVPRLVHADLWPGNVLLGPGSTREIVGVLDAERALWGDPVLEVVGADQLGTGAVDPHVLAGYAATGDDLGLGDGTPGAGDPGAWARLWVYRAYFACLLAAEVPSRAYEGDWVAGYASAARTSLARALDALDA